MALALPTRDAEYDDDEVEQPGTVNVPHFARRVGVHPSTVRIWLRTGRLRGIKLPGSVKNRWRIPRSELERMGA